MTERAYTVAEIDDLRRVCKDRFWHGTTCLRDCRRSFRTATLEGEMRGIEELVRTFMIAGITAPEIRAEDERRAGT